MKWTVVGAVAGLLLVLWGAAPVAQAQAPGGRWADEVWKPILTHHGVVFSYLFYSEADNENNGVVVRLDNENAFPVRYRFRIVFRTWDGVEHVERVEGALRPGEMKTGESAGLFWIPFTDGRSVGEVGLRGFEVTPVRPEDDAPVPPPSSL